MLWYQRVLFSGKWVGREIPGLFLYICFGLQLGHHTCIMFLQILKINPQLMAIHTLSLGLMLQLRQDFSKGYRLGCSRMAWVIWEEVEVRGIMVAMHWLEVMLYDSLCCLQTMCSYQQEDRLIISIFLGSKEGFSLMALFP
jgi:hypothetical protein